MKSNIYCILGKSGAGKSTLKKELQKYGIIPLHECTTRPVRPGEKNGEDYYFFTEDEFRKSNIISKTCYKTENGTWCFGIMKEEIKEGKNYSLVINPFQYREVVDYFNDQASIIPIWIVTDEEQRVLNMILREEKKEKPDYKEVCRRIKSDSEDFSENNEIIKKILSKIIVCNEFDVPMEEIAEELYYKICSR